MGLRINVDRDSVEEGRCMKASVKLSQDVAGKERSIDGEW